MLVKYTVSEFLSAKGSYSSIDITTCHETDCVYGFCASSGFVIIRLFDWSFRASRLYGDFICVAYFLHFMTSSVLHIFLTF